MKTLAIAAAAIGLACTTAPALADESARQTIQIEVTDLDLGTPAGQKVLDQRIEKAARTVCRLADMKTGSRMMDREARTCLAKARVDAREQVAAMIGDRQRGG